MKLIFVNKNTCAPRLLGLENFNDGVDVMEGQQVNFFLFFTVSSLRTFVKKACWVSCESSEKPVIVTAEFHHCFQVWNPSGV